MDVRERRGREIAERSKIVKMGAAWLVPSQSDGGTYRVTMDADEIRCSCPDWELRRSPCKHVFAAAIVAQRTTVTERKETDGTTTRTTVTETAVRLSYPQNWPAYNRAQCAEKETAQALLRSLCDGIVNPVQAGRGRPRTPLRARLGTWDAVAAAISAHPETLKLARHRGAVSASITFRVARVAGVGVDDILSGRYAPEGVCPNCGEKLPE